MYKQLTQQITNNESVKRTVSGYNNSLTQFSLHYQSFCYGATQSIYR